MVGGMKKFENDNTGACSSPLWANKIFREIYPHAQIKSHWADSCGVFKMAAPLSRLDPWNATHMFPENLRTIVIPQFRLS